jgi:metallo-beta-lactamase family protein
MKLTFHGAVGTVTGSQHLLSANGRQVLMDCGLFQGKRQESFERNRRLGYEARDVDALVLSHAHTDHSGNIPMLVKSGFGGNIHATHATRDLCSAMLPDSGHIQEQDVRFVNKRRAQKGQPPIEPLYTVEDAVAALEQFVGHNYQRPFQVAAGIHATFYDAGHILGSAVTAFDVIENGRTQRIVYSGDLGRPGLPILRDPQSVPDVDVLIIESTYGDRTHEPIDETQAALKTAVRETCDKGGKLFIPAFAVGRTQILIYDLHRLMDEGQIPRLPIFIDSPLAINVTEVFRLHPECYDDATRRFIADDPHGSAFGFDLLTYVRSVEESKALNAQPGPFIVIAASGNAETGRILHHLLHGIGDERNTVLIVGYQPPETLGRRLADGMKAVRIFGEEHQVRAQVRQLHGYSAHADRTDLLNYVAAMRGRLRRVFTVHGEGGPAQALADGIRALGVTDVVLPQPGETFEI